MKTTMRTLIVILLAFLLLFPQAVIVPEALAAEENLEAEADDVVTIVNEFTVTQAVNTYFQGRKAFLTSGDTTTFSGTVPGIVQDEQLHLQVLNEQGMEYESYTLAYGAFQCAELYANVPVYETVTYRIGGTGLTGMISTATIEHRLFVTQKADGTLTVAADEYRETFSQFESCSYVDPAGSSGMPAEPMAAGGAPCIVVVAEGEVGYVEGTGNNTKYGAHFNKNGNEWCSMFVTWCADMCNISRTVIPLKPGVAGMRTYYDDLGKYYKNPNQGGTLTPAVGDIYFQGASFASPTHVGIIVAVGSQYITIVDGNSGDNCDRVVRRDVRYTNASFVGFARPNYTTTTHTVSTIWTYDSTRHWFPCENCGCVVANYAYHDMVQVGAISRCSICGYSPNVSVNRCFKREES